MSTPKTDDHLPPEKMAGGAERQRGDDRDREPRNEPETALVRSGTVRADDEPDRDGHSARAAGEPDHGEHRTETLSAAQAARLRKRLAAAVQLAKRAGTEGEKTAALAAINRICLRLGEPVPDLDKPEPETSLPFDFDAYTRTHPHTYYRPGETFFDAWVRIVETDPVFVDIFAEWAQRARQRWTATAVAAAQDYAAEYGVTPDEIDLGM